MACHKKEDVGQVISLSTTLAVDSSWPTTGACKGKLKLSGSINVLNGNSDLRGQHLKLCTTWVCLHSRKEKHKKRQTFHRGPLCEYLPCLVFFPNFGASLPFKGCLSSKLRSVNSHPRFWEIAPSTHKEWSGTLFYFPAISGNCGTQ